MASHAATVPAIVPSAAETGPAPSQRSRLPDWKAISPKSAGDGSRFKNSRIMAAAVHAAAKTLESFLFNSGISAITRPAVRIAENCSEDAWPSAIAVMYMETENQAERIAASPNGRIPDGDGLFRVGAGWYAEIKKKVAGVKMYSHANGSWSRSVEAGESIASAAAQAPKKNRPVEPGPETEMMYMATAAAADK